MNEELIKKVSFKLNLKEYQIKNVIKLLSEGATIPFMARYRKEVTGNLNEDELRNIETEYNYAVNLSHRKEDVKRLIAEKGMLTLEIEEALNSCEKLSEVEEIYAPYKEKRKTKGTEAIKLGLEPLAKKIMSFPKETREQLAKPFLTEQVKSIDEAITNAGYIIADWLSDRPKYRKYLRQYYFYHGQVLGKVKKAADDPHKVYETYYNFATPITHVKPHQILALNRASKEGVITYSLNIDNERPLEYLKKEVIEGKEFPLKADLENFILDAWKRLLEPSLERDLKAELFDNASSKGIKEFGSNLEHLLLTPPIKGSIVMGFDPAFRTGCKLAILKENGEVLEIGVIYPHEPKKEIVKSEKTMLDLINKYQVQVIAIGNGTASRESEAFVANLIKKYNLDVKYVIVSEAGASVYSASRIAQKEFPTYSVEQRSAVSIGRRLQDALSELVKIDPKSIGVGLYQHDLKPKELDEELSFVVVKIVNEVGVNLNNASESLLNYVSGLDKKAIKKILEYKIKNGEFKTREDLLKAGLDAKTFEQSSGFLRILNGNNPLDKTNIHPEDYKLVTSILHDYNIDLNNIGSDYIKEEIKKIDYEKIKRTYNISLEKLEMIKTNLSKGVIDPRDNIKKVTLKSDILTIDDLEIGMSLEGVVRNVTSFGAFVDIGLHDDGLIHISNMSHEYVKDPQEIVKVGDIITVYVKNIDKDKNRVNLSLMEV